MALDDLRNARLLGLVALPPALLLSALAPAVARHGGAEGVAWAQAAAQGLALAGTALLLVRTKRTTGSSRSSALR
jgi:uncharacterized membrane protein